MSSFFRPLLGDYEVKLQIPPVLVSRFPSLTPKTVKMVCSSEVSWEVDIEEEKNKELYFKRGWNTFVKDNALRRAEFIVFKFDGNSTFKAKIYATSYLRRNASTSMSATSFFKILQGENMTTKFRIPLLFVSRYSTVLPKTVTFIIASSNRSWKVDIEEDDDKRLYFKNGWKSFVEDNSLKIAYLLVFKFNGVSTFKVKIFGTTACEKELEDRLCINQSQCTQHDFDQKTKQDRQEAQEDTIPRDVVDQQMSNVKTETPIERMDLDNDHHHRGNSNQETEAPHNAVKEQSCESHDPIGKNAGNMYEGPMQNESSDEDCSLISKNIPTFKIYLKQAYAEKGVMCFPTEFFQKYMKNKRQELEIETVQGVWTVTLLPHMKRTRTFARLSKGWSEFAKANRFKTGETLVFKLVRRGHHPKFLVDRQC